jgi:hypothetical protein
VLCQLPWTGPVLTGSPILPCSSSPVFFFSRVSWCLLSLLLVLDVWAAVEPNRLPDYDINDPNMKVPAKFCSVSKETGAGSGTKSLCRRVDKLKNKNYFCPMKIVDGKTVCLTPPASQGPLCVSCQPYGKFDATSLHVPANSKGRYLHYHPKVWTHFRIVWGFSPLFVR